MTSTIKTLVDSNIIIYSINKRSPALITCQKFIETNKSILVFAHQNFLESLRVVTHEKFASPMDSITALKAITNITEQLEIITPKADTYLIALELIREHKLSGNRIFDAYLAATMLSNGISRIATDNERDFKIYKGIEVYNPI